MYNAISALLLTTEKKANPSAVELNFLGGGLLISKKSSKQYMKHMCTAVAVHVR